MVGAEMWFGEYGIVIHDSGEVWVMRDTGEGLEVPFHEIRELLREYYSENF